MFLAVLTLTLTDDLMTHNQSQTSVPQRNVYQV